MRMMKLNRSTKNKNWYNGYYKCYSNIYKLAQDIRIKYIIVVVEDQRTASKECLYREYEWYDFDDDDICGDIMIDSAISPTTLQANKIL